MHFRNWKLKNKELQEKMWLTLEIQMVLIEELVKKRWFMTLLNHFARNTSGDKCSENKWCKSVLGFAGS